MIRCPTCNETWDSNTPGYAWAHTMLGHDVLCPSCVGWETKYNIKTTLEQLKHLREGGFPNYRATYHKLLSWLMEEQIKRFPDILPI